MTMEPNSIASDHILDWLEGSVSFFPSFLDEPCDNNSGYIQEYDHLWDHQYQTDDANNNSNNTSDSPNATNSTATIAANSATSTTSLEPCGSNSNKNNKPLSDFPKKRNASDESSLKPPRNHKNKRVKTRGPMNEAGNGDAVRKSGGSKRGGAKANGNNCNNGNNKEGRWAEQLLNPCAAAIAGGNVNRVQHLLYVLHELASPTGDPNHRLAAHGLRALTHHLSSSSSSPTSSGTVNFASTEPRFFQKTLLKFYEVSPWFSFPNNIANASILQVLAEEPNSASRTLHILDIGVSHGVQWPTLLDALSRRPGGPPSLVRLTVVTAENDQNMETPFSIAPPGYNYYPRLLGYAQSLNVNLEINKIENHSLQTLNAQSIGASSDEILIVCAQFRLHQLNHNNTPDERSEFLKVLRNMEPKGVILSENNTECCCGSCGNFGTGFSRRVDYLWRFLDSTSSAFKGRESDERRVMEGEAAKALTNRCEMNEEKEKWCGRMKEAGFAGEVFGEDAVDGSRALLRKYDSNWEMKLEEKNTSVELWWKGQPVSFCSLWKLDGNDQGSTS